jgi:hypothetical protein
MQNKDEKVHICTWEDSWTPEKSKRAQHPFAKCVFDGGWGWDQEYAIYECPCCGKRFEVDIPR